MNGIDSRLNREQAIAWASRRWGIPVQAVQAESHPHPTSIGDTVATLTVTHAGQTWRGIGYSGMAPVGVSMWCKAADDLAKYERYAHVEAR